MKIVQITDLHIDTPGEETHGIDIRQNFLNVLKEAVQRKPDHIVLTGDLCLSIGDANTYQWIKNGMELVGIPYSIIAGNHDDSALMAQVFEQDNLLIGSELYYKVNFEGQDILFLDTAIATMSETQWEWLQLALDNGQKQTLIFMHHPPVVGGVPFMDTKHHFKQQARFQEVCARFAQHILVYCGHYHTERLIQKGNLTVHITPSTYYQIDGRFEVFQVDHKRPGYREITLDGDIVRSEVRFLERGGAEKQR